MLGKQLTLTAVLALVLSSASYANAPRAHITCDGGEFDVCNGSGRSYGCREIHREDPRSSEINFVLSEGETALFGYRAGSVWSGYYLATSQTLKIIDARTLEVGFRNWRDLKEEVYTREPYGELRLDDLKSRLLITCTVESD